MELTPQLLETQQFPEKFRGYDCDAVDDFLERVGVGVADLLQQLDTANARIADLERGGSVSPPVAAPAPAPAVQPAPLVAATADVEQISRALLLAQKAADDAVAEAMVEGRRLVAEAETSAAGILQRAEGEAAEIRSTAQAQGEAAARSIRVEADQALAEARNARSDAEADRDRVRAEALDAAQAEADRLIRTAQAQAAALVDEAQVKATEDLERRQRELSSELEELDRTVTARRDDARVLTDLVGGRRETLATVARELEALGERLEDVSDNGGGGGTAAAGDAVASEGSVVIDLVTTVDTPTEADQPEPVTTSTNTWVTDNRGSTDHPAGSESGGATMPRWATIDGAAEEELEEEARPGLHVVEPEARTVAPEAPAPEAPFQPVHEAPPAQMPAPAPVPAAAPQPAQAPAPPVAPEPMEFGQSDDQHLVDDPFLAALRGREPLRGDEVDDDGDGARRRRRRRR